MPITDWFQTLTPRQRTVLPYIALAAAVFAAYANVYHGEFIWDDQSEIVGNVFLRHWSTLPGLLSTPILGDFYRPVQKLLYFIIYQTFGAAPAAFHALNVLLQAVNASLMYRLGCRLGFNPRACFAAALLWGVHPLWSEAVAYISGTASLLVATFSLLGLLVLLPIPTKNPATPSRQFWLASLFLLLALGSKQTAIVFPALATFTLFLASKERLRPSVYLRTWPLWLIVAIYITAWVTSHVSGAHYETFDYHDDIRVEFYEHNFINRVFTSLATLPVYLGLVIWPADLHVNWNFPIVITPLDWQVIGGLTLVIAALFQIARGRGKRGLPLSWGFLWFAAALSPYTGILKPINAIFAENWIYLATIGLFLGLSQTMAVWIKSLPSKKAEILVAGLVILATLGLGARTYQHNKTFHDAVSLYENVIRYNPESAQAHFSLGSYYFSKKQYAKAAEQWRIVEDYNYDLGKSLLIEMHTQMAFIYLNSLPEEGHGVYLHDVIDALPASKHVPEAIKELKKAQSVDPEACCANTFLAGIYYYLGDKKQGDYYNNLTKKSATTTAPEAPAKP